MFEKFKSLLADDTIFGAILLILVGFLSFGLGRLSVQSPLARGVESSKSVQLLASSSVLAPAAAASGTAGAAASILALPPQPPVTGPYVASKSGTKYYLLSCSVAKRIKDENKVFFATTQDAAAAGYEPASTCPGL